MNGEAGVAHLQFGVTEQGYLKTCPGHGREQWIMSQESANV